MDFTGIVAILSIFVVAPTIVFTFVHYSVKGKREIEMQKLRNEQIELEIERDELKLKRLELESRTYDRIIDERDDKALPL